MSFPITTLVLDAIETKLSDDAEGINPVFNALAAGYGLTPPDPNATLAINFVADTAGASNNFVRANIDPDEWEARGAYKFPLVTLFGARSTNKNYQKFHQFSGDVQVGLHVFLSWRQSRLKIDFQSYADCMEETVVTLFNRARNAFPIDQEWGDGIVYNGDISLTRSRIGKGGEGWSQLLAFQAEFQVDQRGTT